MEDCTRLATDRGWSVAETYVDNDVSASTGRRRPEYERLLDDIKRDRVSALVVWDIDRLTRTPAELETLIDLAEAHGVALASVGGEVDLGTPQGRLTARIKGSVARHEVEQSSRRLKRKFLERAESGLSHGKVAYGYVREPVIDETGTVRGYTELLHPEQAAVIQTATKRILAGEPLRAVASALNETGSMSPSGKPWSGTTLRQVLLRDRNAGRRVHQKQVIGKGNWPAILDDDSFDRLVALLRDPRRRTGNNGGVKHLLSGIAICGNCGERLRGAAEHRYGKKKQPRSYACQNCYKVRRKADAVDEVVEALVIARLERPDAADLFAGDSDAMTRATSEKLAIEARLDLLADQFADGLITGSQLERGTARLRPKLAEVEAQIIAASPSPEYAELVGPGVRARWEGQSLDRKRAVIDALMRVTVLPSGAGQRFSPEQVEFEWSL
ncbi:recombinase family protein [Aeromicrobium sp. Leaf289]|uniref:recombinase family protein n=1 Tax=Aeromicrobium sp. Leaf289 TaxID=1736324 RepID=UPI001F15C20D|nr:recombinase family protein [Aeromicrobium sp. Leaf289]